MPCFLLPLLTVLMQPRKSSSTLKPISVPSSPNSCVVSVFWPLIHTSSVSFSGKGTRERHDSYGCTKGTLAPTRCRCSTGTRLTENDAPFFAVHLKVPGSHNSRLLLSKCLELLPIDVENVLVGEATAGVDGNFALGEGVPVLAFHLQSPCTRVHCFIS